MTKEESKLEEFKRNYEIIKTKFDLPDFQEMNQDFFIEKLAENETEILIREIRRYVGDKLANYMRFIENLLNPTNVPFFILSLAKALSEEDKKKLSEIYTKLVKNEMHFIERDIIFSEVKEADFVKNSFELWKEIKENLNEILKKIHSESDKKLEEESKSYFG